MGRDAATVQKNRATCAEPGPSDVLVVFDGVCGFCNSWVSFIYARDQRRRFWFVAAQSERGRRYLQSAGYAPENIETILAVTREGILDKSDAIIKIMTSIGGLWRLAFLLRVLPKTFRDLAYLVFARNRYLIAGRTKACEIPRGLDAERFLL
ncbi:thiol-disulfide oxidoreductase DCC family protein [Burkholderia ubonensis]|uniref:thiol-disulfide oxidoreductase DCC family protein n=1 Tax=Burkholderia ubonensis TaxID=101571 RepID=UPI0012FB27BE|nr:DCC1-like thiol-disulfide oxidoreductase family protein [Burkholderia ubonensis]